MKKWTSILFLFILIMIGAVYFFIPTRQNLSYTSTIKCTEAGAVRLILNNAKWHNWWPGETKGNKIYSYKDYRYRIEKTFLNYMDATISDGKDSVRGKLQIMPSEDSSILLQWSAPLVFSNNPVKRLLQYLSYSHIKNNIQDLFTATKKYFENEENIYGMRIVKLRVTESSMIALKQTFNHYPSTAEIYSMINSVKEYIAKHAGEEDNYPMFNLHTEDSKNFEAMVAIPTKKDLPAEGNFSLKKFPLGYMLMAEIKGGVYTVMKGENEFTNYINDYQKHAPAIPFQSLLTNRLTETDTSKWVTRLYYPVFF